MNGHSKAAVVLLSLLVSSPPSAAETAQQVLDRSASADAALTGDRDTGTARVDEAVPDARFTPLRPG